MPVYTMICKKCGAKDTFYGTWKESEKVKCPKCESLMSRKIGKTSFYFRRPGSN